MKKIIFSLALMTLLSLGMVSATSFSDTDSAPYTEPVCLTSVRHYEKFSDLGTISTNAASSNNPYGEWKAANLEVIENCKEEATKLDGYISNSLFSKCKQEHYNLKFF